MPMFCRSQHPEKIVAMPSILVLGGVLPLAGAYLSQKMFGLFPCHFCLLQRYPYLVVIAFGALLLVTERMGTLWRLAVAMAILALLVTGGLGLIHTGIERDMLAYKGGCVAEVTPDQSIEAIRSSIMGAPLVSCKEVAAEFLSLSMASWNTIWAAFVLLLIVLQYRFERARRVVL